MLHHSRLGTISPIQQLLAAADEKNATAARKLAALLISLLSPAVASTFKDSASQVVWQVNIHRVADQISKATPLAY